MSELLRRLLAQPGLLAELLAASFLINLLGLASTAFVMLVLGRYVPYGIDATLVTLTTGIVIAAVFEFAFREARRRLAGEALAAEEGGRARAAFAALIGIRAAIIERLSVSGRREIMQGVETVERAYTPANLAALLDVPFSVLTLLVLFVLSPLLGLISALFMGLSAALTLSGERWSRGPLAAAQASEAELRTLAAGAAGSPDCVRAFNGAAWLLGRWQGSRQAFVGVRDRLAAGQGIVASGTTLLVGLQGVAIIAVGAVLCVKGQLDTAQLIGANILAGRALGPITRLAQLVEPLARAGLALARLAEFQHLPREQASGAALRDYSGRLEFVDLAVAHPGAALPLAEHVSLTLAPGSILLVAGPNGSGKTTFARLLAGLADPIRGQILADGLDMRQLSQEWWRRQICYLPQEPDFLDATLAETIRLANPALDEEAINRVVLMAGLKPWLDASAKGFDTPIVESGRQFPPGIRRRLALARALATEGRLCVFDEPTEGLDAEGRAIVYATLAALAKEGRTLVICGNDPGVARGAGLMLDLGHKPVPRLLNAGEAAHG